MNAKEEIDYWLWFYEFLDNHLTKASHPDINTVHSCIKFHLDHIADWYYNLN